MRIADCVEVIELPSEQGLLYLTAVWDADNFVFIDTGLPRQMEPITQALNGIGYAPKDISRIILTHQDMDHVGNARELSQYGMTVSAYEEEVPYIDGSKMPVKLADMAARLDVLSPEERAFFEAISAGMSLFTVPIEEKLTDGQVLPECGGIRVIHTPGHTPGHISLYLEGSGILVAGDAANIVDGKLTGADAEYSIDMAAAEESFAKIMTLPWKKIVCYHGGVYER